MTMINVQFADSTDAVVIAYLAAPVPEALEEYWPNTGTLDTSDQRWATYYNMQPALIQAALPAPPKG